jgi:hypothetical protein
MADTERKRCCSCFPRMWDRKPKTEQRMAGIERNRRGSGIFGMWGRKPKTEHRMDSPSVVKKRACSRGDFRRARTCDATAFPAYDDEQSIEYFSIPHQQWLRGTVYSRLLSSTGSRDDATVSTTVTLFHGQQTRENVGLDLLRSPFKPGERVELFSGRQGGLRLAATIAPDQKSRRPILHHYRVVVDGSKEIFENVPPHRLKRRYVRGQEIEVYRGPQLGWELAEVHHTASADGCSEELLRLPSQLHREDSKSVLAHTGMQTDVLTARNSKVSRNSKLMDARASECSTSSESHVGLWSWVPVCTGDSSPEWVQSYLICPSAGADL